MNISVVIPAYNASSSIERAIGSVLSQKIGGHLQIVIVNDGSTDDTSEKVKKIIDANSSCQNIDFLFIDQVNRGVATARNVGVENSRYDWIAFLDSDDEWVSGKLASQIDVLSSNPKLSLVAGNFEGLNVDFSKLSLIQKGLYEVTFDKLIKKHYFQPSTTLVNKDVFNSVGGFKDGMTHGEEGLLFFSICYKYKCAILESVVINYGNGKHPYASNQGLASNLWRMELSELLTFSVIAKRKMITKPMFVYLCLFSLLKYIRRLVVVRLKNAI